MTSGGPGPQDQPLGRRPEEATQPVPPPPGPHQSGGHERPGGHPGPGPAAGRPPADTQRMPPGVYQARGDGPGRPGGAAEWPTSPPPAPGHGPAAGRGPQRDQPGGWPQGQQPGRPAPEPWRPPQGQQPTHPGDAGRPQHIDRPGRPSAPGGTYPPGRPGERTQPVNQPHPGERTQPVNQPHPGERTQPVNQPHPGERTQRIDRPRQDSDATQILPPAGAPRTAPPAWAPAPGGGQPQPPRGAPPAPPAFGPGTPDQPQGPAPAATGGRRWKIWALVAAGVLVLAGAIGAVAVMMTSGGGPAGGEPFQAGTCVVRSGDAAKAVDCSTPDAFKITSREADADSCPDPSQPHVDVRQRGRADVVLCLAPAG
jgi:hypothetical protein